MNQMIRVAIGGLALHSTWATLQHPGLTDAQLSGIQGGLTSGAMLPGLIRAFEVERASIDRMFVNLRTGQETFSYAWGSGGSTGWSRAGEQMTTVAWRIFLSDADELFYLRSMQRLLDALRKAHQLRSWSAAQPDLAAKQAEMLVFESWRGKLLFASAMAIPNFNKAMQTAVRFETRRELRLAAIA